MNNSNIVLKKFFDRGRTLPYSFRIAQLKKLQKALTTYEPELLEAIHKDFKKSTYEAYITELILLHQELKYHIKHLKSWMRPQKVSSSLLNFPSSDYINAHPLGSVLIISPWNYPILLSLLPLIGAISAGNCVVLKPSEFTSDTSQVLKKMLKEIYPKEYIQVHTGDASVAIALTAMKWDKIFFTGSTSTGQKVYEAAAKNLTPVTLELGGKSPCVVFEDAPLQETIERIFFGKYINAGQTCIAPDYVWIHEKDADDFVAKFNTFSELNRFDITSIIHEQHEDRLRNLLPKGLEFTGYPQAFRVDDFSSPVMQEEIFGPLLPVKTYSKISEIKTQMGQLPSPLAFYVFTKNESKANEFLKYFHFGGAVINDVMIHMANDKLPFGGVGHSGIGQYHGAFSFDCFSYKRPVVIKKGWKDLSFKQLPFSSTKLKWIKRYRNMMFKK